MTATAIAPTTPKLVLRGLAAEELNTSLEELDGLPTLLYRTDTSHEPIVVNDPIVIMRRFNCLAKANDWVLCDINRIEFIKAREGGYSALFYLGNVELFVHVLNVPIGYNRLYNKVAEYLTAKVGVQPETFERLQAMHAKSERAWADLPLGSCGFILSRENAHGWDLWSAEHQYVGE